MFRSARFLYAALLLSTFTVACGSKANEYTANRLAAAEATTRRAPTPEAFIDLSLRYFEVRNYPSCITAAADAIRLKADTSIAYNNQAACYGGLGQWDEEIAAARQALRLSPDFQLARSNLEWAESQKRKATGSK